MKLYSTKLIKLLLVLIGSLLIFVFNPEKVLSQAYERCPYGSFTPDSCAGSDVCWSDRRIDLYECFQFEDSCFKVDWPWPPPAQPWCEPCDISPCRTSLRVCSSDDVCGDSDPHPDRVDCGWNGSIYTLHYSLACTYAGCCGPAPSTPPPSSTPPPPPENPPTCSISGETSVCQGDTHSYPAICSDSNGNLTDIDIYWSPTSSDSWNQIGDCSFSARGSESCSGSKTWDTNGTYYVEANGLDNAGKKCSGNPWCEWPPNPPSVYDCTSMGWSDCTASDVLTVTVSPCLPGECPAPGLGGNGSCDASYLLDMDWSWDSVAGATSYRFQMDNDPDFSSPEVDITDSGTSVSLIDRTPGCWYGRVQVETSDGSCTAPSTSWGTHTICLDCVPPPCSCTLNLVPAAPPPTDISDTTSFTAIVSDVQNGTIDDVAFSSSDITVATVSPASDVSAPYTTTATSIADGGSTISAVASCNGVATCSDSSLLTVLPPPECTVEVDLNPNPIDIGETSLVTTTGTVSFGTIERVNFYSSNTLVATVSPASDSSFPYSSVATGLAEGPTTITAKVVMDGLVRCEDDEVLIVNPPSCTVSLTPSSANIELGDTRDFFATVNPDPPGFPIDQVNFSSSNPLVVSVTPSDDSIPYQTTATGVSLGSGESITAAVVMAGAVRCKDSSDVDVVNPQAWWQVWDGSVLSNGNLESRIPIGCKDSPLCDELFIIDGPGGFPGVPAAGSSGYGEGEVSSTLWEASTGYRSDRVFSYQTFEKMVPSDVVFNEITVDTITDPSSLGGAESRGYYWYHYRPQVGTTPLTINTDIDFGTRKVILFVEGADLNLSGTIKVDDGEGFFMTIVQGDINIDANAFEVSGPALEGIYVADGDFDTGAGSETLYIRGMVAAYGQVDLRRNRDDNSLTPAEIFEYAPDLVFNFPPFLARRKVVWREVAP